MTDQTVPETARLVADVALFGTINRDLHVLAIRRRWEPFTGNWALPGGHVDVGEQCLAAAHRELAEETGLRVSDLHPFAVYADPGRDPRGRYVTFAYTARVDGTPAAVAGDDAAEVRWILVDDVLTGRCDMAFDHSRIIADASRIALGPARATVSAVSADKNHIGGPR